MKISRILFWIICWPLAIIFFVFAVVIGQYSWEELEDLFIGN